MPPARILVVEDEGVVAKDLARALSRFGHTVSAIASSGRQAVHEAAVSKPDLVLMDIKLRGELDGIEAAQQIHADLDVPVVYLTAYANDSTLRRAKITEPFGYVVKPFADRELQSAIEMALFRHDMERRLKQSERRFRSLVENVSDIVTLLDCDYRIRYVSPSVEKILGFEPGSLLDRHVSDFVHPNDVARIGHILTQSRPDLGSFQLGQARLRHKDGSWRWLESVGNNRLEDPVVKGIVLNSRDITERRQAEKALEQQLACVSLLNEIARAIAARQHVETIIRVVVQRLESRFADLASIWFRDADSEAFTVVAMGPRFAEAAERLGLPQHVFVPSEPGGLRLLLQEELVYIEDLVELDMPLVEPWVEFGVRSAALAPLTREGKVFAVVVAARRGSNAFSTTECEFFSGLGEHVSLAVHHAQVLQEVQAAYDDLHERKQAISQHERLRALGEMASGIAHDINNAISPITLYTALIGMETGLSRRARDQLRIIERAVSDVEETVGRMRQFYTKRGEEDLAPVVVSRPALQAIELTRPRWRDVPHEKGIVIDLETDFAEDLPPVVGSEGEIRQAVTNLIFNAVDAMPDGGTLSVRTSIEAGTPAHVSLEVIDTGVGMDEMTRDRCLEPFFSAKGERGTGLGLPMVYGTMQRHGGDVQVESTPGQGTKVRLVFPVPEVADVGPAEEAVVQPPPLRILCIDDEPLLAEALRSVLGAQGHAVEVAIGGESGLEAFIDARQRGEAFDVVITDLGMPHVGGRQVARTVKDEAPETPVILLTGWGMRLSAENDIPAAVDTMVSKPPTIEALNRALVRVTSGD